MQFNESEIHQEIRNLTRKFIQSQLLPNIQKDEEDERFRPEWIQEMGNLGLCGIPTPESLGGMGLGYSEYMAAIEEIASCSLGYAISVSVSGLPQLILNQYGTEEQKKKYIPDLAAGKAIGSFALSEASSGSDAGSLKTTAEKKSDHYLINGTKLWITQANHASTFILMARTGEPGPKGISAFILEKGMPGLEMGKKEEKMGCAVSHTMEIVLNEVKVPLENLIGQEGDGFKIAMTALDAGRITMAACGVGVARGAFEVAARYSQERQQFGKAIGDFQGVGFLLADMGTAIESSRLLTQKAAFLKDSQQPFTQAASMAKLFATDSAMKVTTDAVQILGGAGYTREFPVERHMREAKVLQIVEGTNQIQRWVIAKHIAKEFSV